MSKTKGGNLRDELLGKGYSEEAINIATRVSEIVIGIFFLLFAALFLLYLYPEGFHRSMPIALYGMIRSILVFIL